MGFLFVYTSRRWNEGQLRQLFNARRFMLLGNQKYTMRVSSGRVYMSLISCPDEDGVVGDDEALSWSDLC